MRSLAGWSIGRSTGNTLCDKSIFFLLAWGLVSYASVIPGIYYTHFLVPILLFSARLRVQETVVLCLLCAIITLSQIANSTSDLGAINRVISLFFLSVLIVEKNIKERLTKNVLIVLSLVNVWLLANFLLGGNINLSYLLKQRDWGKEFLFFWGNGVALLGIAGYILLRAFKSEIGTIAYWVYCINLFSLTLLSTSRLAFLLVLSVMVDYIFDLYRSKRHKSLFIFSAFSCLLIVCGIIFLPNYVETTELHARITFFENRLQIYSDSAKLFLEQPLLGIGGGEFTNWKHAHNSFIQPFVEYGIFGGLLSIILFLLVARRLSTLGAGVLAIFLLTGVFQLAFHNLSFALIIALACSFRRDRWSTAYATNTTARYQSSGGGKNLPSTHSR